MPLLFNSTHPQFFDGSVNLIWLYVKDKIIVELKMTAYVFVFVPQSIIWQHVIVTVSIKEFVIMIEFPLIDAMFILKVQLSMNEIL